MCRQEKIAIDFNGVTRSPFFSSPDASGQGFSSTRAEGTYVKTPFFLAQYILPSSVALKVHMFLIMPEIETCTLVLYLFKIWSMHVLSVHFLY